jgi:hypothetical protein
MTPKQALNEFAFHFRLELDESEEFVGRFTGRRPTMVS